MADLQASATTEGEVALVAATAKTVLQIAAATNHRVKLLGWGVYFDGTSGSGQPVVVRLLRQTTAGTMTSVTPKKTDTSSETVQTGASKTATAEPTAGDVLAQLEVHPQGGYEITYPLGQEIKIGGGGRVGIECTAPAGVNAIAVMRFEE